MRICFFITVQLSLRTLANSQILAEGHCIQQLLILLGSLENTGCNGYNYELMALNSPSDPNAWFFCLVLVSILPFRWCSTATIICH